MANVTSRAKKKTTWKPPNSIRILRTRAICTDSISHLRLTSACTDFRDMSRSLWSVKNTLIFEYFLFLCVY